MCIFCGDFIANVHWTEFKEDATSEIIVGDLQRSRQQSRIERVQFINKILVLYQLKLTEWNGSKFILSDLKGNTSIVHDLGTLWAEVEKLNGYAIDPLSADVMEKIMIAN
ncbi:hypothetical protein ACQKNX_00250 [Lysinibacillus sp. NPDC093712]|uniref:hypothetical protein n=1 Tax=Lysinibacillus sp. NPDC093712 TaxID=3390579 RepID=UPI003D07311C